MVLLFSDNTVLVTNPKEKLRVQCLTLNENRRKGFKINIANNKVMKMQIPQKKVNMGWKT